MQGVDPMHAASIRSYAGWIRTHAERGESVCVGVCYSCVGATWRVLA